MPLIASNCWTIGRSEDNNMVLTEPWISRNHAMLQQTETGDFYLIDLGSRNGTFINGRRVSIPVTLRNGDRLTFGQTEVAFYYPSKTSDSAKAEIEENLRETTQTVTLHQRRLISVMVVDIRNFTVLTQNMDEILLSEMIGSWFRQAGQIIRKDGSWVDKYIGDAIMAVWFHGTDGVSRDELQGVLRSLNDIAKMTQDLASHYPLPFPLRVGAGINTGYAMVGNTGSGDRPDYTALGDTVNSAFRLESSTKQIGRDLALGATTYQYLVDLGIASPFFKQYTLQLKGYETATLIYACSFAELNQFLQTLS